jgi:Tfp pilus assembly PilM family ATPase
MAIVWGIDTGSWRTRAVQLEGSFRRFEAGDAHELPTIWDEGKPLVGPSVKLLGENNPRWLQGEKLAALPMELGTIRLVKLPFTDKNTIEKALPGEVEGSVPYDLEEMVLANRLLDTQGSSSRSLAFLAKHETVASRLQELKSGGVDPKILCFDVDALASYSDRGAQVVCDIGHRRTLLALCQGGKLLAGRMISMGSGAWTAALAERGMTWNEAESFKHQASLSPDRVLQRLEGGLSLNKSSNDLFSNDDETTASGRSPGMESLEDAVTGWLKELRTQLIALEDLYECGLDELLLCGGGSLLSGLADTIGAMLGIPIRPVAVPGGHSPAFALSAALGQAAANSTVISDLRIGDLAHHGESERLWTLVSWGGAGVGLAVVAGLVLFGLRLSDAWGRLADLDDQIEQTARAVVPDLPASSLASSTTLLAMVQEASLNAASRVEALGPIVGGLPPTLERLKQISRAVPSPSEARIDVRELNIGDETIIFKAETDSYETAARIEEFIKKEQDFAQAHKDEEKKVGETLQFTMTIPLGEAEEEQAPAEPGKEG